MVGGWWGLTGAETEGRRIGVRGRGAFRTAYWEQGNFVTPAATPEKPCYTLGAARLGARATRSREPQLTTRFGRKAPMDAIDRLG